MSEIEVLKCRVCGAPLRYMEDLKEDEEGVRYFECRYCGAVNVIYFPSIRVSEEYAQMRFRYRFWNTQKLILEEVEKRLKKGEKRFFIVAPPGSGKTIVGMELIRRIGKKALVLVPTSAIQQQWIQKISMFGEAASRLIGESSHKPITVLTYQSFTSAPSEKELLDEMAIKSWVADLREMGYDHQTAMEKIEELRENAPDEYKKEMSARRSRVRKLLMEKGGDISSLLHQNAILRMELLKAAKVKVLVLDECHHLTGLWWHVVRHMIKRLGIEYVIGLTATPPDPETREEDYQKLAKILGDVSINIPLPVGVIDGVLSPYQNLIYFVETGENEKRVIATLQKKVDEIISEITGDERSGFKEWIMDQVINRRYGKRSLPNWGEFFQKRPDFSVAALRVLHAVVPSVYETLPAYVKNRSKGEVTLRDWLEVLGHFAISIRRDPGKRGLYSRMKKALYKTGYYLSEKGIRKIRNPIMSILIYSPSKWNGFASIIEKEYQALGDKIRVVVITDYEKMNPLVVGEDSLERAGGCVGIFKYMISHSLLSRLDPVVVTGKTIYVDEDLRERIVSEANKYFAKNGMDTRVRAVMDESGLWEIKGEGMWGTKQYVGLMTEIFRRGITKCLIGTRSLLGEGWDCPEINVLIDMTSAVNPITVTQIRGRGIRKDPTNPRKVCDIWDIVTLSPATVLGYYDFARIRRKYEAIYGVNKEGKIESGIAHVDERLIDEELSPALLLDINKTMLSRASKRNEIYELWNPKTPYSHIHIPLLEIKIRPETYILLNKKHTLFGIKFRKKKISASQLVTTIARVLLYALRDTGKIFPKTSEKRLKIKYHGNIIRIYMDSPDQITNETYIDALQEILSPVDPLSPPKYILPVLGMKKIGGKNVRTGLFFFAVPRVIAHSMGHVQVLEKYWNSLVAYGLAHSPTMDEILYLPTPEFILSISRRELWR